MDWIPDQPENTRADALLAFKAIEEMDTILSSSLLLLSVAKQAVEQQVEKEYCTVFQSLCVGACTRKLDKALHQCHTKSLYNNLKYEDASALIQLRIGDNQCHGTST